MTTPQAGETRRAFLQRTTVATAALAAAELSALAADAKPVGNTTPDGALPWFRRVLRWGQTNITEADVENYDIAWWRQHWKRTHTQGVIINAGGIFAYYPSKFPLHHRAAKLGDRDLYGELARAAHADGLAVLARMDSNRAHEEFYQAHPDWFTVDGDGRPFRSTGLYVACVNGPYYDEYIPSVLREIIERSQPEGFADNSWSGLERDSICQCANCQRKFREKTGQPLPRARNWDDAVFRQWIEWSYARRLEVWDLFNRVTREAGGAHCLWMGMNGSSISSQARSFRDCRAICERSEIVMLDHQARNDATGFQYNGEAGKLIHGLLGWDKLIPESMAMYQAGRPAFRLASKPEPEARLWMLEGFAGGIQPWWHHVGAYHEDRRMYRTAEPVLRWHAENQAHLVNRQPIASVGLVWSQRNTDYYGRDNADELIDQPWRGWVTALIRARILWLPVHADHIARDANQFSTLILPNLAAMSAAQVDAVRHFVERGGGLVATGDASRCGEWGEALPDFALADLFGAHVVDGKPASMDAAKRRRMAEVQHTYLRLSPERRGAVDGPKNGNEPAITTARHPALMGFDETDLLPFGGVLEPLKLEAGAVALATFVPSFPAYPPEMSYMREPRTDIPGLVVNQSGQHGRVAYLAADIDRRYGRDNLPDQANLLANVVRWTAQDNFPVHVQGPGFLDVHLYQQQDRLVMHLVNLTNAGTWRASVDELITVGPLQVRVRLPSEVKGNRAKLLVSGHSLRASVENGWAHFEIPGILDHEVAVIS